MQNFLKEFSFHSKKLKELYDTLKLILNGNEVYGLTELQFIILIDIRDKSSKHRIESSNYFHGTNVSYTLDRLEKHGYITKENPSYDRRKVDCYLTKKGLDSIERVEKAFTNQESQLPSS